MKVARFAAPALVLALAQAGCVTRTVYVVDDRDDDPIPATARATASAEPPPRYEDDAGIRRVDDFYEPLSPYGRWVSTPAYGMVFVPSAAIVGVGFRPYTHGHWVNTEWGWTWVDHHPFGWATGHYGRWYYDASYGWVWVPGTVWAPAWVSWRTGGGYVGWAPMPPGAAFGGVYTVYDTSWVFVSYSSMGVAYVGNALIVGPAYRTCYVSTSPYRETYVVYGRTYYRGPAEDDVVRAGGHVVHRPIREVDNDRAVTRPPAASTRDREDADGRTRGRPGRDDGNRSDGASGNPRDRDDGGSRDADRDDGVSGGPRDRDDGRGGGAPGPGDDSDGRGRGDDGRGRGDEGRGRGDGRGRPGGRVDDRGNQLDDVTPRLDPAAGLVGERGETGVGVPEPDGLGVGRGERDPVDGERGGGRDGARPGSDRQLPELTPWRDDRRPPNEDPENPDRFKPVTDPLGARDAAPSSIRPVEPRPDPRTDARMVPGADVRGAPRTDPRMDARPVPSRGPAMDRPSMDPRAPVTGNRPGGVERAPRVQPDRAAPPAVGTPVADPAQPTAEHPPQGSKKDSKKGKTTKKVEAKKR